MTKIAQFIVVRKNIQLDLRLFATEVAKLSLKSSMECFNSLERENIIIYKKWCKENYPIFILGCDNEDELWKIHKGITLIEQYIPRYVSVIKNHIDGKDTVTGISIGPCDTELVRPIMMNYQTY